MRISVLKTCLFLEDKSILTQGGWKNVVKIEVDNERVSDGEGSWEVLMKISNLDGCGFVEYIEILFSLVLLSSKQMIYGGSSQSSGIPLSPGEIKFVCNLLHMMLLSSQVLRITSQQESQIFLIHDTHDTFS